MIHILQQSTHRNGKWHSYNDIRPWTIAISTTLSSLTSSSPNNQLKSHDGLYLDIHDIIGKLFIPHLNHVNRTFYLFVFHVGHLNANIYLLIILPLFFRS